MKEDKLTRWTSNKFQIGIRKMGILCNMMTVEQYVE